MRRGNADEERARSEGMAMAMVVMAFEESVDLRKRRETMFGERGGQAFSLTALPLLPGTQAGGFRFVPFL